MRTAGLPDDILTAIVERIRSQVPELNNASRCFLALNSSKTPLVATGDVFCVVTPLSGAFQQAYFDGGGQRQLTVEAGVVAKIISTAQIDPAFQDALFLTGATRGIFKVATKVLQSLADWSPLVAGDEVTRDPLVPHAYSISRADRNLGAIELEFKITFDWNLQ